MADDTGQELRLEGGDNEGRTGPFGRERVVCSAKEAVSRMEGEVRGWSEDGNGERGGKPVSRNIVGGYACRNESVWGDPVLVGIKWFIGVFREGVSCEERGKVGRERTEGVCAGEVRVG